MRTSRRKEMIRAKAGILNEMIVDFWSLLIVNDLTHFLH
jgi:hypothetical protein